MTDWSWFGRPNFKQIREQLTEAENSITRLGFTRDDLSYAYAKSGIDTKGGQTKYTSAYVKLDEEKYIIALSARSYVDNHNRNTGRLRAVEKLIKAIKYFNHTSKVSSGETGPLFFVFYLKDTTNTPVPSNDRLAMRFVRDLTLWNPCTDITEWETMYDEYRIDVQDALLTTALAIRKSIEGLKKRSAQVSIDKSGE